MSPQSKKNAWLLTAFDPFAGRTINNSKLVLEEIQKLFAEAKNDPSFNLEIYSEILPVEYDRCFVVLKNKVDALKKEGIELQGILSLGEGAEEFKIETQAHNLDDVAELADNAGVIRANQKIIPELDQNTPIPVRFPFEAFSRIRTSKNAGFYICNHLLAKGAYHFAQDTKQPYFGFIHVPRAGQGGMFTADVCAAVIFNGLKKVNT